jgi:hypothetical protein
MLVLRGFKVNFVKSGNKEAQKVGIRLLKKNPPYGGLSSTKRAEPYFTLMIYPVFRGLALGASAA